MPLPEKSESGTIRQCEIAKKSSSQSLPLLAKADELGCAFYPQPQASDDADMQDFVYVYSSPGLGFGLDT